MSQIVETDSIGPESPTVPAGRPEKTVKVHTQINQRFIEEKPVGAIPSPLPGPRPVIPTPEPTRVVMAVADDDDEFEPDPLSQLAELCGDSETGLKVCIYRLKCDAQGRPLVTDTRGMKADYGQFCGTIAYADDLLEQVQRVYGPGEYLLIPRAVGRLFGKRFFLASIAEPRQAEAIQAAPRNDLEADFLRANRMLELKAKLDEFAIGGMIAAFDRVMDIQARMAQPNPAASPEPIPDTKEGALVYLSKDDPELRKRAVEILFRADNPEPAQTPGNFIEQALDFIQGNPSVMEKGMSLLEMFFQRAQPPQPEQPPRVLYAAPPGYVLLPVPQPPTPPTDRPEAVPNPDAAPMAETPEVIPSPQTEPPTAPEEMMPQEEAMNPLEEMIQELLDEAERNADDIESGQWTEETENNRVSACAELVATFRAENPDYESDIGDVSKTPVRFVVNQLAAEFYADNPNELKTMPRIREFITKLQKAIKKGPSSPKN